MQRRSPSGNPFLVIELWRELTESGALRASGGRTRLAGRSHELATPEAVREVVSQRLGRLDPATIELLELAAVAGRRVRRRGRSRAARALDRSWALPSTRRGRAERDDRGGAERPGSATASPTSWCAARSTTGSRRCAGPSCTCGSREALEAAHRHRDGAWPSSPTTSPAAAPLGDPQRAVRVQPARRAPRRRGARLRRGRPSCCSTALELGRRRRARSAARSCSRWATARFRAGESEARCEAFRHGGRDRPRARRRRAPRPRAAVGLRERLLAPGIADPGARGCSRRPRRARRRATRRCG